MSTSLSEVFGTSTLEDLSSWLVSPPEPVVLSVWELLISTSSSDVSAGLQQNPSDELVLNAWNTQVNLVQKAFNPEANQRLHCLLDLASVVPDPASRLVEMLSVGSLRQFFQADTNDKAVDPYRSDLSRLSTSTMRLLSRLSPEVQTETVSRILVKVFEARASFIDLQVFTSFFIGLVNHSQVDVSAMLLALSSQDARLFVVLARACSGFYDHVVPLTVSAELADHLFSDVGWLNEAKVVFWTAEKPFSALTLDESCASWVCSHPEQLSRLLDLSARLDPCLAVSLVESAPASVVKILLVSPRWWSTELDQLQPSATFRFVASLACRLVLSDCKFSPSFLETTVLAIGPPVSAAACSLGTGVDDYDVYETSMSRLNDLLRRAVHSDETSGASPLEVFQAVASSSSFSYAELLEGVGRLVQVMWPALTCPSPATLWDELLPWLCRRAEFTSAQQFVWLPKALAALDDDVWRQVPLSFWRQVPETAQFARMVVELPPGRLAHVFQTHDWASANKPPLAGLFEVLPSLDTKSTAVVVGLLPSWEGTLRELVESARSVCV